MHPLSNGRDISSYFCKFAPICKAPLYARMFGNFLYNTGRSLHYSFKILFQWFCILCVYFSASTFNGRDISSFFCKFAPICKAPLYARMFGNLLYQHKKAITLLIKNIFSMVLYSSFAFQCIHFPTGGIFLRTSVNSPLYVRHPYLQGCLVNLPYSRIRTADVRSWKNEVSNLPFSMFIN